MTPSDIIAEARRVLQDSDTPYRYSDTAMLSYVNQTVKRMVVLRPDLFGEIGDIPVTPDTSIQTLPSTAYRLIDIFQVKGGNAITEVNRELLSRSHPDWMNDTAGSPVNYMRHVKNAERFFLYPRPASGTVLVGEYARVPDDYTLTEEMDRPNEAFMPTLVDGVVFLAESIDDEHINTNRAKLFLDLFTSQLTASLQSRIVTDTKPAGMKQSRADQILGEVI